MAAAAAAVVAVAPADDDEAAAGGGEDAPDVGVSTARKRMTLRQYRAKIFQNSSVSVMKQAHTNIHWPKFKNASKNDSSM